MGLLEKKRIIVTGGASGIGAACAKTFASQGADFILIADLNDAMANDVCKQIREMYDTECVAVKVNVTSEEEIDAVFAEYKKHRDGLDVMFNCAGIGRMIGINDITCDSWDLTMNVNARAAFLFARKALDIMEPQQNGRIINMASQAGKTGGYVIVMDYAASKAAVLNLTKSLAKKAAPYNITVNSIAPGFIATAMTTKFGYDPKTVPLGRIGTPEEVADVAVFLASELSRYVTGACIDVNGGILMS